MNDTELHRWLLGLVAPWQVSRVDLSGCFDQRRSSKAKTLALVDSYNLDKRDRARLVDMLGPRIRSMYEFLRRSHETGVQPWSKPWSEGHRAIWLAHAHYVEGRCNVWPEHLNTGTDFVD